MISNQYLEDIKAQTIGKCTICKGEGTRLIRKKNKLVYEDCTCKKVFSKRIQLIKANIRPAFWKFNPEIHLTDTFKKENKIVLKAIHSVIANLDKHISGGTGLLFQAHPGLAKSSIASWMLRKAIEGGYSGYMVRMTALTSMARKAAFQDEDSMSTLDYITNVVDVLVIDELEKDYKLGDTTGFSGSLINDTLSEIFDSRPRLLIGITNTDKKGLRQVHASNIADRFEGMIDIIFVGESFRKKTSKDGLEKLLNDT